MRLLLINKEEFDIWLLSKMPDRKKVDWSAIAAGINQTDLFHSIRINENHILAQPIMAFLKERDFTVNEFGNLEKVYDYYTTTITVFHVNSGHRKLNLAENPHHLLLQDNSLILVASDTYLNKGIIGTLRYKERPIYGFREFTGSKTIRQTIDSKSKAVVHYDEGNHEAAIEVRENLYLWNTRYMEMDSPLEVFSLEADQVTSANPLADLFDPHKRLLYDIMGYFNGEGATRMIEMYAHEKWLNEIEQTRCDLSNFVMLQHPDNYLRDYCEVLLIPFRKNLRHLLDLIASVELNPESSHFTSLRSFIHDFICERFSGNTPLNAAKYDEIVAALSPDPCIASNNYQPIMTDTYSSEGIHNYQALDYYSRVSILLNQHGYRSVFASGQDMIGLNIF